MKVWFNLIYSLLRLAIGVFALMSLVKFCLHGNNVDFQWFVVDTLILIPWSRGDKN